MEAIRHDGWLPELEATVLLRCCREGVLWEQRNVRVFGRSVAQPRLVALFGAGYGYSGDRLPARAMPDWLAPFVASVSRVAGVEFNSILLNRYRDGRDSIAWHRDDEPELGPQPIVASLSLGATRRFLIRERNPFRDATKASTVIPLHHGDLLIMPAGFQDTHEHSMPKTANARERISLTFRRITQGNNP